MKYRRVDNDFDSVADAVDALRSARTGMSWRHFLSAIRTPSGSLENARRGFFASSVAMPDDWLQAVAELPQISEAGLKRLAEPLKTKGYVSLKDALDFVKIERGHIESKAESAAADMSRRQIGASMLLERAERELPGWFERINRTTRDVASAASGYATFTLEKAIWLGKGLGFLGSAMRRVRT